MLRHYEGHEGLSRNIEPGFPDTLLIMAPEPTDPTPPSLGGAKARIGFGKVIIGAVLIGLQLIRQPGFGFFVGDGLSAEILGYDMFALAMYVWGAWLIYRGFRPKQEKLP